MVQCASWKVSEISRIERTFWSSDAICWAILILSKVIFHARRHISFFHFGYISPPRSKHKQKKTPPPSKQSKHFAPIFWFTFPCHLFACAHERFLIRGPGSVMVYRMLNHLFVGQTLSVETINEPNMRHFWETVTTSVMPRESGGHVDIFVPLVETGKCKEREGRGKVESWAVTAWMLNHWVTD